MSPLICNNDYFFRSSEKPRTLQPKVLINVPRLDQPGGVANYFMVLRKYLPSCKEYLETGIDPREVGFFALVRRALSDFWRFHRKLSAGTYSLVHLNPSMVPKSLVRDSLFLLIARTHSVPVLVFFRGWDSHFVEFVKRWLQPVFRYVFGKSAAIVVLAEDFRRQLEMMGVKVRIFRATTCVDDAVFSMPRRIHGRSPHTTILFLSRLDHGKGVVESVRAFTLLKRRNRHVKLIIAGEGPARCAAERVVKDHRLNDVEFLGHVSGDAKQKVFLRSDIFFFPTFFGEGMPNAVLEAMAYGLPVVTRTVGGLADFFENERMGWISDSRDPAYFADKLERLVQDPEVRRRMGEYNRLYAKEHFSASKVAKNLEALYVEVAA